MCAEETVLLDIIILSQVVSSCTLLFHVASVSDLAAVYNIITNLEVKHRPEILPHPRYLG